MTGRRPPNPARMVLIGLGLLGFVGLLVMSGLAGAWATPLRVFAGLWFLSFGAVQLFMARKQGRRQAHDAQTRLR